jgi:hypothetical protein
MVGTVDYNAPKAEDVVERSFRESVDMLILAHQTGVVDRL